MDSKAELLLNGKNLVFLATTMPDGAPQVTPVWGNFEDSHILINTAEGRLKGYFSFPMYSFVRKSACLYS